MQAKSWSRHQNQADAHRVARCITVGGGVPVRMGKKAVMTVCPAPISSSRRKWRRIRFFRPECIAAAATTPQTPEWLVLVEG
jgi:hypothetical protein